jgi:hypothetical protein
VTHLHTGHPFESRHLFYKPICLANCCVVLLLLQYGEWNCNHTEIRGVDASAQPWSLSRRPQAPRARSLSIKWNMRVGCVLLHKSIYLLLHPMHALGVPKK